nr:MAG TPA: hypothetical protein [Caudoviricetes sp.]
MVNEKTHFQYLEYLLQYYSKMLFFLHYILCIHHL